MELRNRRRRTLNRIFARPTPPYIRWDEAVSLLRALDVEITEAAGSRVRLRSDGKQKVLHRPHPKPYLSRGAVRDIVDFLNEVGVSPYMEYKGYIAEFEYDDIVELYSGRVINSGPYSIVTIECEHEEDLPRILQEAIDDYLSWCAEDGVEPVKPSKFSSRSS